MVNNSININKANSHFLHQLINMKNTTTTYNIGNPESGLGQAQQCDGVRPVNGSTPPPPSCS
jgi:hypothetical protein